MSDTLKQFAELRRQAEQGNAEAQYKLGHMYEDGKGVPAYDAEAVKWYRLAAAQGAVEAQFRLGVIYASKGRAVPTDDAEAMTWWSQAAERGHRHAQHNLGIMYTKGETSSGGLEAFFLYDGHSNFSQVNGVGAPTDYVRAYAWLNLAAAQEFHASEKNRNSRRNIMTTEQIARAQELSATLFARINERG